MSEPDESNEFAVSLKLRGLRACGTCVKAKVKCTPSPGRGKCQRCNRLDKVCEAATISSRKKQLSRNVLNIEQKLDRLVTLFAASNLPEITQNLSGVQSTPSAPIPRVHQPPPQPGSEMGFCLALQPQEADLLLVEYTAVLAHQFPFVVIPPGLKSESLQKERPMLWGAVMTAASYATPLRQEAFGWKLIEELSTRILLKAEKSLDLVQGLLVHLSWYHYHTPANPQFMNLLSLCKSLVMNLGYHRTRTIKDCLRFQIEGTDGSNTPLPIDPLINIRKFEEWRALAGCFFLSSMYVPVQEYREFLTGQHFLSDSFRAASSCRRADPLPYTKNLEEGCKMLSDRQEYPGDRTVACLVALQNVVVKSNVVFNETEAGMGRTAAPIRMHAAILKCELDAIVSGIPVDIRDDPRIMISAQVAEISVYEYSLYSSLNAPSDTPQRLTILYSCLLAVKTYFSSHLALTSPVHVSQTYSQWIHSSYALLMAIKLCACKAEGWDYRHAREFLALDEVIDGMIGKLEVVARVRNPGLDVAGRSGGGGSEEMGKTKDIFVRYLRHMRFLKVWYEPMLKGGRNANVNVNGSEVEETAMGAGQREEDGVGDTVLAGLAAQERLVGGVVGGEGDFWGAMDDCVWQMGGEEMDWMMMGM